MPDFAEHNFYFITMLSKVNQLAFTFIHHLIFQKIEPRKIDKFNAIKFYVT